MTLPAVEVSGTEKLVEEKKADIPRPDDPKALAVVEKTPEAKTFSKASLDRDIALAGLDKEKRNAFIKAWEESEKSKVESKAQKKLAAVCAWENTQKAKIEAKLKKLEEDMEKKKAEYAEKIQNKVALVHKGAEEKRAMVEARRGEDLLKAEEMAAKHRATGYVPKSMLGCMGG